MIGPSRNGLFEVGVGTFIHRTGNTYQVHALHALHRTSQTHSTLLYNIIYCHFHTTIQRMCACTFTFILIIFLVIVVSPVSDEIIIIRQYYKETRDPSRKTPVRVGAKIMNATTPWWGGGRRWKGEIVRPFFI